MANAELNPSFPPYLHLVCAFLAMEPSHHLISLARVCGGGLVTERVQKLIWDHCVNKADGQSCARYLKNFLKKLIIEIESNNGVLMDELYEQYAEYMTSLKEYDLANGNAKVYKYISFLFQDGCLDLPSCPTSRKLIIPLQCSLNMLEGDTGCSIWPSSLFLSEFILSFPEIFSNKSCFEVGSGVGLVGICLANVRASKIVLSDGDLTTLSNMKQNLELNKLSTDIHVPNRTAEDSKMVKCISMAWESATESELQEFMPDIVLGADVIYDPLCLPHLVQVLAILLNPRKSRCQKQKDSCQGTLCDDYNPHGINARQVEATDMDTSNARSREGPVAYIASVIRNIDTFNCFLALANQANLTIVDVTDERRPFNLLPYMQSYDRSSIQLFSVSCKVTT
ncbi:putative uncharacterized protein DDB_G0277003 [Tripterygium wilfordii]|uniref:putative uncharacterized protein DDB_G0277003 n=1 Tax=Tripterygium wilfordii TaxID=458696 RepID=UPI0018F828F1|nr:putative uncharacterized protein DDB_G0277003 [Tripterygium wilfordii]